MTTTRHPKLPTQRQYKLLGPGDTLPKPFKATSHDQGSDALGVHGMRYVLARNEAKRTGLIQLVANVASKQDRDKLQHLGYTADRIKQMHMVSALASIAANIPTKGMAVFRNNPNSGQGINLSGFLAACREADAITNVVRRHPIDIFVEMLRGQKEDAFDTCLLGRLVGVEVIPIDGEAGYRPAVSVANEHGTHFVSPPDLTRMLMYEPVTASPMVTVTLR